MRRTHRPSQIEQLIRGRRMSMTVSLAQSLEACERTVCRGIADLQHRGALIEGEVGRGYRLGFDLSLERKKKASTKLALDRQT